MYKPYKGVFNVHERAANIDFEEQMREFYGLPPKHRKYSRKTSKKSVLARIEYQLQRISCHAEFAAQTEELKHLLHRDFNETTFSQYEVIMDSVEQIMEQMILEFIGKDPT